MRNNINITVATSADGCGGIATVLTGYQGSGFLAETNSHLISTHKNEIGKAALLFHFLKAICRILKLFILNKVEIVHIHMASRGSYSRKSMIVRLSKLLGAKVILHLHGAEFKQFYESECNLKKQKHINATFALADKVIVLSSQWKLWVNTIVEEPAKVCVVYNAVPELNLPAKNVDKMIILFLGRLGERKGVDDLIEAFSMINKEFPEAELYLGGDGNIKLYEKMISELQLDNKVKLLGWISGDEKAQHLANATIYCLPSYNEGFPMGVLEAMSSKIPVVSSKAGGIPDAIVDEKEGLLINAGDVATLAKSLSILLRNESLRKEYASAAYGKYVNNFSPAIINAQLRSIYTELTN